MKRLLSAISVLLFPLFLGAVAPFRFALLTDIHISPSNPQPKEDLSRSIDEVNNLNDIAFVIVSGDITEAGDKPCMEFVKQQLDRLSVPYYVTSGNHETTWSESGVQDFAKVFGSERFSFTYNDILFFGFNTGPVLKMADGHVAPQDIDWIRHLLDSAGRHQTAIPVTHYPLQTGDVDNWFDLTDVLRRYNVPCLLGGHYHRNLVFNCDGIPDILCRSNLRGKDSAGGFSIISIDSDSLRVAEKKYGCPPEQWVAVPLKDIRYGKPDPTLRPDYSVNKKYRNVKEVWKKQLAAAVYSSPAFADGKVYVGDDYGFFYCLDARNGRNIWKYKTGSRINSVAAVADGRVFVGSTDGALYCFSADNGTVLWKYETGKAVMGCPVITEIGDRQAVLFGGSDGSFRALNTVNGKEIWVFNGLNGYVVTRPCIYNSKVYFGAWDCHFYALNLNDGSLVWKWSNGHPSDKFSPAAVWPVASDGKIFIVAPDRVFTCLDAENGSVIYRTKQHMVRENIGISDDGNTVYSRCMRDSVQAMSALSSTPVTVWKRSADYGYDHNPSMMVYNNGILVFGTKNGLLHGVDAADGTVLWRHKIGNSVLNTVCPLPDNKCLVSSTEGTVTLIQY